MYDVSRYAIKNKIERKVGTFATSRKHDSLAPGAKMPKRFDDYTEAEQDRMIEEEYCKTLHNTVDMINAYSDLHDTDIDGPAPTGTVEFSGMTLEAMGSIHLNNDTACKTAKWPGHEGTPHTGTITDVYPEWKSEAASEHMPAIQVLAAVQTCAPDTPDEFKGFVDSFPDSIQPFFISANDMARSKRVRPWVTRGTFTHKFPDGTEREIKSAMRAEPKIFPLLGLEPTERVTHVLDHATDPSKQSTTLAPTTSTSGKNSTLQRERLRRQARRSVSDFGSGPSAAKTSSVATSNGPRRENKYDSKRVPDSFGVPSSAGRSQGTTRAPPTTQASTVADSSAFENSSADEAPTYRPGRGRPSRAPTDEESREQNRRFAETFGKGKGRTRAASTCASSVQPESRVSSAQTATA